MRRYNTGRPWRTHRVADGRKTKLYSMWDSMLRRCAQNRRHYEHVSVCREWHSFEKFRSWACDRLRSMPREVDRKALSIDRKDSSGNYEPGNCRLIPLAENSRLAGRKLKPRLTESERRMRRLETFRRYNLRRKQPPLDGTVRESE